MKDEHKAKEQLINELAEMRQRVAELETAGTERKRAEDALQESEREKSLVLNSLSELVTLQDRDLRIIWANRAAAESVGSAPEQLAGRHCYEIWYQRGEPCVGCPVAKAIEIGQPQEAEMTTPDRRVWFIQGYPVREENGDVIGAVEVTLEITERKRAEKALREAHEGLERRVEKRTAELTIANEQLKREIEERRRMEEALLCSREETLRNHQLLLALSHAAQAVQRARTPEEVYQTIGDEVTGLGYHAMVFVLIGDRDHVILSHMTFEPAWLRTVEELSGLSVLGFRFPLAPDGLFRRVIAEGESAFCERTAELVARGVPGLGRPLIERLTVMLGIEKSIYAPLRVEGETHGLLGVASTDLTEADVPAITAFANQAAIAIENAQLLGQVDASRERLRRLTQQTVSAQEEERQRLSRALHDEAGQALTALKISLELIQEDLPVESGLLRQRIGDAAALTTTTMEQIRLLAQDLRPPALDAVGLGPTLQGFCRDFAKRTQLSIDYLGLELPMLPEATNICLYRFLQEALTNVAKHARANQVYVALRHDAETISLSVEDDGRGFEGQTRLSTSGWPMGIGLLGMQERLESLGGRLEIKSRPGQGTRLVAYLPAGGISWEESR